MDDLFQVVNVEVDLDLDRPGQRMRCSLSKLRWCDWTLSFLTVMSMISAALASCNSEELLSIINASPTLDTISQLTDAFIELSRQNPEKTDDYASALTSAKNSWKVPKTNGDPSAPQDESFEGLLIRYFYNALTAMLHESSTTYIQPSNSYIVASVVSGTAIRRGLCFSSAQIGHIFRGLHFSGSDYKSHWGPERYEINAVGACVHLIAAGKEVYNGSLIEEAELKKRLRKIKSCIKDPAGLRILEVSSQRDCPNMCSSY